MPFPERAAPSRNAAAPASDGAAPPFPAPAEPSPIRPSSIASISPPSSPSNPRAAPPAAAPSADAPTDRSEAASQAGAIATRSDTARAAIGGGVRQKSAVETDDDVEADPARWAARIAALRATGRDDEADRALARLRARYPSFVVPRDALRVDGTR